MGAPRVHRNIAGNSARELRRWIGGVKEPIGSDPIADGEVGDPGFYSCKPVGSVDFEDSVHSPEAHDHRVFLRDGTA
jgi:hypothetical protein